MDKTDKTLTQLNELLAKSIDAKKGYHKAAEEIDNPSLKGFIMCIAEQRENFRRSLREEICYLGGQPVSPPHDPDFVMESFAQPDLLVLINSVEQTLDACLKNELKNLTAYEEALSDADASALQLVIGQRENVKLAINDLRNLYAPTKLAV
ncbi:DUF2383 domain-containing protein [Porifericola rhodea]|uniref:DUF2383 domain-containing protein n=1 Tax=Porifericola rhodea TaxID=930972 RepID=UPI002665F27B|nr:DUF2383 domain-containing protein [Porifericola rhodea]WKN32804.1 DUF2383 domain-containing protein [Porifericola rhodea]